MPVIIKKIKKRTKKKNGFIVEVELTDGSVAFGFEEEENPFVAGEIVKEVFDAKYNKHKILKRPIRALDKG